MIISVDVILESLKLRETNLYSIVSMFFSSNSGV